MKFIAREAVFFFKDLELLLASLTWGKMIEPRQFITRAKVFNLKNEQFELKKPQITEIMTNFDI